MQSLLISRGGAIRQPYEDFAASEQYCLAFSQTSVYLGKCSDSYPFHTQSDFSIKIKKN